MIVRRECICLEPWIFIMLFFFLPCLSYGPGTFKLTVEFTEEYPNKPPTVRFVSKMFHPNGMSSPLLFHCNLKLVITNQMMIACWPVCPHPTFTSIWINSRKLDLRSNDEYEAQNVTFYLGTFSDISVFTNT